MLSWVYPHPDAVIHEASVLVLGQSSEPIWLNEARVERSPEGFFASTYPLTFGTNTLFLRTAGGETLVRRLSCPLPHPRPEGFSTAGWLYESLPPMLSWRTSSLLHYHVWLAANVQTPQLRCLTATGECLQHVALAPALPPPSETAPYWDTRNAVFAAPHWQEAPILADALTPWQVQFHPPTETASVQVVASFADAAVACLPQPLPPRPTPSPPAQIRSFSADALEEGWSFSVEGRLSPDTPVQVQATATHLCLHIPEATPSTVAIRYGGSPFLASSQWGVLEPRFEAEGFRCDLPLPPRFCGWRWQPSPSGGRLLLRQRPQRWQETRICLDAGHGGDEIGCRALDGSPEKAWNLAWALALQASLQAAGFQHVSLTRSTDATVSLAERVALAAEAQVLLSLHFNALPDGRNPQEHQGACCFYQHPHSYPVAQTLQAALVHQGAGDYGLFVQPLALTRPTHCHAVLLELGFLIHPENLALLQAPATQASYLNALTQALLGFLRQAS